MCIYVYMHVYMRLSSFAYIRIYIRVCVCVCAYVCLDPGEYSIEKLIKLEGIAYEIYFDSSLFIEKCQNIHIYIQFNIVVRIKYILH